MEGAAIASTNATAEVMWELCDFGTADDGEVLEFGEGRGDGIVEGGEVAVFVQFEFGNVVEFVLGEIEIEIEIEVGHGATPAVFIAYFAGGQFDDGLFC